ncbi:MAG: short-chain dehydrogenase [uncultured archaeon A07HB70]|nr:MAG: short-chain dehydrogenase [uncultured archaeon A07HB70]
MNDDAAGGPTVLTADPTVEPRPDAETALVTGASSGIGNELAARFAADGSDVVLVARSGDRLREVASAFARRHGVAATPVRADLSTAGSAAALAETLDGAGLVPDVLVNNAGFGVYGPFTETDGDEEATMRRLNVETPTRLAKRYAPGIERRGGGVLNVASIAAIYPSPGATVYGATKAYLLSFSEALAEELAPAAQVTALCPGETDTGFMQRGGMADAGIASGSLLDPADVARAGYRGFRNGDRVVVPGWRDRLRALLKRVLPRAAAVRAAKRTWTQ